MTVKLKSQLVHEGTM